VPHTWGSFPILAIIVFIIISLELAFFSSDPDR
jgi:hypothetical protein